MPNNGFEGMRFLGYPVLRIADAVGPVGPVSSRQACARAWRNATSRTPTDPRIWRFRLRRGVTFHDGTPFNADAVIWNMDRYFRNDSPQFERDRQRHLARTRARSLESATARSTTSRSR
jgi:peptide/nickel transport system substrate-binding protein